MNNRYWPRSEEHPPMGVLLLNVEGELDGRESALVRQHIADCWDCRVRCEDLEKGIHAYVVARRNMLIPNVPPPPSSRHKFIPRLYAEAAEKQAPILSRLKALSRLALAVPLRVAWFTGAVSVVMAVVIFVVYVANPPTITAATFFERIRRTENGDVLPGRFVAVQKIRLEQGGRSIQRNVVHRLPTGRPPTMQRSAIDRTWIRSVSAAQIDWNDPLSSDRFERWHDLQGSVQDLVTQTKDAVTLTTSPRAMQTVLKASLTVRRTDWHPVAERFDFSDQPPLEVREISFELHKDSETAASIGLAENRVPSPASPADPSDADLQRSEISAREALHRVDADRDEVPDIIRQDRCLAIRAKVERRERERELLAALKAIPYVKPEIEAMTTATGSVTTAPPTSSASFPPPGYSTTPPLAKELWNYKGGMDVANNYLDVVREWYFRTLADANALKRLAHRYSGDEWARLPPDVRVRVNRLASDYVQATQKEASEYLRQLSDPLDEMLRQNHMPAYAVATHADAGCQPWQDLAPQIVADLQNVQTPFRRLFVVDQTDAPLTLSADRLLDEVVQLRSRLIQEMRNLCLL